MRKYLPALKTYIAVLLAALLAASVFTGCGQRSASSAEEMLQSVTESAEEALESVAESAEEELQSLAESGPDTAASDAPEASRSDEETPQEAPEASESARAEESAPAAENDSGGLLTAPMDPDSPVDGAAFVTEDGEYSDKEHVAAYLYEFGHLPSNYITKKEAEELGWISREGNLWEVAPGKSIGGSRFGNYEGMLPDKKGRKYYECDINFDGTFRGAERIIYSNDGLIFYTGDHYETFEQLY